MRFHHTRGTTTPLRSLLLALALLGCVLVRVQSAEAASPATTSTSSNSVVRRVLELDARLQPVSGEMLEVLDDIVREATRAIDELGSPKKPRWNRAHAESVLRRIDEVLLRRGFLYPATGTVDQLADSLRPFQMPTEQRRRFASHPANGRRSSMIAARFPGPFFLADCDTASLLYLAVAERSGLPLRLVTIPALNRRAGHTFVRWREGTHHLNWETMDGRVQPDEFYLTEWKIRPAQIESGCALVELTTDEVLGSAHYQLAIQHERRRDYPAAVESLSSALALFPHHLDARREFAWLTATAPGLQARDLEAALSAARDVARIAGDADSRDTLAAALAAAGRFDEAAAEERAALTDHNLPARERSGYQRRLELYLHLTPYTLSPAGSPVNHEGPERSSPRP